MYDAGISGIDLFYSLQGLASDMLFLRINDYFAHLLFLLHKLITDGVFLAAAGELQFAVM